MKYAELVKAVARKYLRRVATGNPKRPWRYIYKDSSEKKATTEQELTLEQRFDQFLSEYESMSQQNPIGYPGDRYWYMGEHEGKHCLVMTNMSVWDGQMMFNSIQTVPADVCGKKGFASKVMNKVVDLADKHQIPLSLEAMPFGQEALSKPELESWYKRSGFKQDSDYDEGFMVREPKASSKKKSTVYFSEKRSPLEYNGVQASRIAVTDESAKHGTGYFDGSKDVAFLDYSLYDGGDRVFIHYMKTRDENRGQGHGRALLDSLYERFKDKKEINWGKIMHDHALDLFQEYKSESKVPTYGKVW